MARITWAAFLLSLAATASSGAGTGEPVETSGPIPNQPTSSHFPPSTYPVRLHKTTHVNFPISNISHNDYMCLFYFNRSRDSSVITRSSRLEWDSIKNLEYRNANHFYLSGDLATLRPNVFYPPRTLLQSFHNVLPAELVATQDIAVSSAVSPSGRAIVGVAGGDIRTMVIDPGRTNMIPDWPKNDRKDGHRAAVVALSFSPGGSQLITASHDNTAKLIDAKSGRVLRTFRHDSAVECASFSPDGNHVVTGCRDGIVRIWDTTRRGEPTLLLSHGSSVTDLAFNSDASLLVSSDSSGNVVIHRNDRNPVVVKSFQAHSGPVSSIRFRSPNDMNFATGGEDGRVRLWHSTGKLLLEFNDHRARVNTMAWAPDGLRLLTAGEDRKVNCYFIHGGKAELRRSVSTQYPVISLSFHHDGRAFLVCGDPRGVSKLDLVVPDATVGLILANPIVDRRYREASIAARPARRVGPAGAPGGSE